MHHTCIVYAALLLSVVTGKLKMSYINRTINNMRKTGV